MRVGEPAALGHASSRMLCSGLPSFQELSVLMDGGPSPSAPWGNKLGLFLLPLPIKTDQGASKKDPGGATSSLVQPAGTPHTIETLQAMKKMCDSKKLSVEAMFSYLVSVGTMELVGSWVSPAIPHSPHPDTYGSSLSPCPSTLARFGREAPCHSP